MGLRGEVKIQKCLNYSTKTCLALAEKKKKLARHTLHKWRTFSRVASEQQTYAGGKKKEENIKPAHKLTPPKPPTKP